MLDDLLSAVVEATVSTLGTDAALGVATGVLSKSPDIIESVVDSIEDLVS